MRTRLTRMTQSGLASIEFAMTATIFFVFLFALIEFSRFMFAWNTAAEATRLAARLASICDLSNTTIQNKVRQYIEASGQINIPSGDWLKIQADIGDNPNSYSNTISVELFDLTRQANLSANLIIPLTSLSIDIPSYKVVTLRESMRNEIDGKYNPACQ